MKKQSTQIHHGWFGVITIIIFIIPIIVLAVPALRINIPNQSIEEGTTTTGSIDLDNHFTGSCSYSVIDDCSIADMTVNGNGTVDFTTATTTGGDVALQSAQTTGTFTSRIMDATASKNWSTVTWETLFPSLKNLPNSGGIETAYQTGNADMTNNKLLMHFDESTASNSTSIADNSGNSHTGTLTTDNGATEKITAGKLSNAIDFDGTGDYVTITDHDDFNLGSSDMTLSTWVRFDTVDASTMYIIGHDEGAGDTDKWILYRDSGNVIFYFNDQTGPTSLSLFNHAWTPTVSTWYHLAVVRSGSNWTLYIDGVSVDTDTGSATFTNPSAAFTIGYAEGSGYFNGAIDEVSLIVGTALSNTNILNHYKRGATKLKYQLRSCDDAACSGETFVGPGDITVTNDTTLDFDVADEGNYTQEDSTSGTDFASGKVQLAQVNTTTKLLLHADGSDNSTTFTDTGNSGHTVTVGGAAKIKTAVSKFGGSSAYFDDTSDTQLTVDMSSDLSGVDWDTVTFTVEAWVYIDNSSAAQTIFGAQNAGLTEDFSAWRLNNNGGTLKLMASSNGTSWDVANILSAGTVSVDTWYHMALTYDNPNNTLNVYVDGLLKQSVSGVTNLNDANKSIIFGNWLSAEGLDGYMDDMRVTITDAGSAPVYSPNFTVPSSAYTSDANTKLLLHADGTDEGYSFTDSGNTVHTITNPSNGVNTEADQAKFGSTSAQFSGLNPSYLNAANHTDWNYGTNDLTIDFWMYATGASNERDFFFKNGTDSAVSISVMLGNATASDWGGGSDVGVHIACCGGGWQLQFAGTTDVTDSTWHHIAVTRSGTLFSLYIDGVLENTGTYAGSLSQYKADIGGQSFGDRMYTGYMDEIRVSNVVRFGGFTPPTTAFTDAGYTTTQAYYVTTTDTNQFNLNNTVNEINSVTVSGNTPTNTTNKWLVSFDDRASWKYKSGDTWYTASDLGDLQTNGMTTSVMEAAFTNWDPADNTKLDFAVDLKTTDTTVTPDVNLITINYDAISNSTTTYYSELSNSTVSLPSLTLSNNITANRYFQYKAFLDTDNATYSPKFRVVTAKHTADASSITDDANITGGFSGGTHSSTEYTKASSDTVQFRCTDGSTADSNSVTVTIGNFPVTPNITSPTLNATGVAVNPVVTSSVFDGNGTHASSDWQIYSTDSSYSNDCTSSNLVWCKQDDTTNKTSTTVNTTNGTFQNARAGQTDLADNTIYYIRTRHTNATGDSEWSVTIPFTTIDANSAPVASAVSINSGASNITLTENTTTNVTATATVTDADLCGDIDSVAAKFYRTSVGAGAGNDDNDHYSATCSQDESSCSGGADTTATYTCTFAVQYFADPTDVGSYSGDTWTAQVTPTDGGGAGTADTDTIEMDTLNALNVTTSINYGTLGLGTNTDTTNQTTVVTNTGNGRLDVNVRGYGASPADGYALACTIGNLNVVYSKYSISTFDYDLTGTALTASDVEIDLDVLQRTGAVSTQNIYWGLGLPATGVGGICNGTIVIEPVADSSGD